MAVWQATCTSSILATDLAGSAQHLSPAVGKYALQIQIDAEAAFALRRAAQL